mgnify:CR=1 FL=1
MQVLVSAISLDEAQAAHAGGADIIDVKNVDEGSLGANYPWVIRDSVHGVGEGRAVFAASIGDLDDRPGNAALAAVGAVASGARYVKAGLHGVRTIQEGVDVMNAVRRACRDQTSPVTVVAAGYADHARFGGLDPSAVLAAAVAARCDVVMLDTAIKDGRSLFDALDEAALEAFVSGAHATGLTVALAGAIRFEHIERMIALGADIVGVRSAVCVADDRRAGIDASRVRRFTARCRELAGAA